MKLSQYLMLHTPTIFDETSCCKGRVLSSSHHKGMALEESAKSGARWSQMFRPGEGEQQVKQWRIVTNLAW